MKNVAPCQEIWKHMLCFLDTLLFFPASKRILSSFTYLQISPSIKSRAKIDSALVKKTDTGVFSSLVSLKLTQSFKVLDSPAYTLAFTLSWFPCVWILSSYPYSTWRILLFHATSRDFRISLFMSSSLLHNHFYSKSLLHLLTPL